MEDILVRARNISEDAEVFMVSSEETPVQFETNRLKHIQSKETRSLALRIVKQGRIGYATTTDIDDSQNLVNMAVETAQFGQEARFEFPSLVSFPQVDIFDPGVESVATEEMVKLGEELINRVREHTPSLICEAAVTRGITQIRIMNSRGGQAEYKKSFFSLSIEGQLIRGTDMLFVGDSESSCRPIKESDTLAEIVIRQLEMAKDRASAPTKSLPVIFTPHGVAGTLMMPLIAAFNGKTVLDGASPVGNKLGQEIFDKKLSIRDDPTIAYRPASRPCDDEGVPSQRTPLIEDGNVTSFFYDLQTAAQANTRSTGNGNRGHGGLPSPSPSAIIINPGNTTFDEMVGNIKEGLVVEQLMGAGQGNILGGDFSGNVLLGYKVENGKIVGRVKDTMVSGNIYQLLKDTTAIGSEPRWVGSFLNTPPLYLSGISVASK